MFRLINVIKQINTKTILKLTNNDTAIVNAVSVNKYCQVKPTPTLKIDEDHLQDEFTGMNLYCLNTYVICVNIISYL